MKLNKIKNNEGFTLIELIVALTIISIVSMAFYTIINSSIKHNTKNEKDIKSLNIAQSEIESLRNEIKSNNPNIQIYDSNGDVKISIPTNNINNDSDPIRWMESRESGIYVVDVDSNGIYGTYIDPQDSETLLYYKTLENDPTEYAVKLKISRQSKASKFIYNIEVKVGTKSSNFSKKETVLTTSILSK